MIVRAAAQADIAALADIAARAYREGFTGILDDETLSRRDSTFFAEHFRDKLPRLRLAERDGEAHGFTLVTDGHLDMLFVAPDRARRGAGRALLADAVAGGARTLECFRDNRAARAFYERAGWRPTCAYEREFIGRARAFVFYEI